MKRSAPAPRHMVRRHLQRIPIVYTLISFGVIPSILSTLANIPLGMCRVRNMDKVMNQFGDSLEEEELHHLLQCQLLRQIRTPSQIRAREQNPGISRAEFIQWLQEKSGRSTWRTTSTRARTSSTSSTPHHGVTARALTFEMNSISNKSSFG